MGCGVCEGLGVQGRGGGGRVGGSGGMADGRSAVPPLTLPPPPPTLCLLEKSVMDIQNGCRRQGGRRGSLSETGEG